MCYVYNISLLKRHNSRQNKYRVKAKSRIGTEPAIFVPKLLNRRSGEFFRALFYSSSLRGRLPWVPEGYFSRRDRLETRNRARKASGTQGSGRAEKLHFLA